MSTSTSYDLLIRGGTVIDGTKAPRFDADVAIKDARIAAADQQVIGRGRAHAGPRDEERV